MKPRINALTLAVTDLQRSLTFYRDGLGLPTEGVTGTEFEKGDVVFFHLESGVILALYRRDWLASESGVSVSPPAPSDFSIGHFVSSKERVDELLQKAQRAGAKLTDGPRIRAWGGYSGYFTDLDGHLWEIAFFAPWNVTD